MKPPTHRVRDLDEGRESGPGLLMVAPDASAPSRARKFVSHRIGLGERRVDDAVLATSELVSNAVEHGGDSELVAVRVFESDEIVRVEVAGGGSPPHLLSLRPNPDPASLRGRGLEIVTAVTDRAGSLTGAGVWFEIDR